MLLNLATKGAAAALQSCSARFLLEVTSKQPHFRTVSCPSSYSLGFNVFKERSRVSINCNDLCEQKSITNCASTTRNYGSGRKPSSNKYPSASNPPLQNPYKSKFEKWISPSESHIRSTITRQKSYVPVGHSKANAENPKHKRSQCRFPRWVPQSRKNAEQNSEITISKAQVRAYPKSIRKKSSRVQSFVEEHNSANNDTHNPPESVKITQDVRSSANDVISCSKGSEQSYATSQVITKGTKEQHRPQVSNSTNDCEWEADVDSADEAQTPPQKNNNHGMVKPFHQHSTTPSRFLAGNQPKIQPRAVSVQKQTSASTSDNAVASISVEKLKDGVKLKKNISNSPKESNNQISTRLFGVSGVDGKKEGNKQQLTNRNIPKPMEKRKPDFQVTLPKSKPIPSLPKSILAKNKKEVSGQQNCKNLSREPYVCKVNSNNKKYENYSHRFNQERSSKNLSAKARYYFTVRFGRLTPKDTVSKKQSKHIFPEYDDFHPSGLSEGLLPFVNSSARSLVNRSQNSRFDPRQHVSRPPETKTLLTNKKVLTKNPSNSMSGCSVDPIPAEKNVSAYFNDSYDFKVIDDADEFIREYSGGESSVREAAGASATSGANAASGASSARGASNATGADGGSLKAAGAAGGAGGGRGGRGSSGDGGPSGGAASGASSGGAASSGGRNSGRDDQSADIAGLHSEPFLSGSGSTYVEEMYRLWRTNPEAVHASWNVFFRNVTQGAPPGAAYFPPPGIRSTLQPTKKVPSDQNIGRARADQETIIQQTALQQVTNHYQMYGHLQAEVDPLQYRGPALGTKFVKAADRQLPEAVKQILEANQMKNMKKQYLIPMNSSIGKSGEKTLPLEEILKRLQNVYCQYIGIEYMHIPSLEKRQWIREQFETGIKSLTVDERKKLCERLIHTSAFEEFLSRKWPTLFRFSVEGCEILVPILHQILDKYVAVGTDHFVLGMAHRGRLNVMANILNKDIDKLLLHFKKDINFDEHLGDVKYHLGCYVTQKHEGTGKDITICIVSNASHLESVNPMVQGRCKAEQILLNDQEGKKVVPIIIHGDAAYAGQGVVYEQNTMCTLPDYNVHGTLHLVINNNTGFTTPPEESRSAPYCTDVAKLVHAPVFHVNSEKPDEVMHSINVACAYRNRFHSDVVVDIVCYRRHGHNEADEPAYTSPVLYSEIRARKPFTNEYIEQLLREKVLTQEVVENGKEAYFNKCEEALKASEKHSTINWRDWNDSPWKDFAKEKIDKIKSTGVPENVLKNIAQKSLTLPKGFEIHKLLQRVFQNRKKMIDNRTVDWALAETLAYGTLLKEGVLVRLSGQDAQRGTFSHRHHVLHHQKKDKEKYVPLNHLSDKQGNYNVLNSPLIEYGALAFEIGFAMSFANALVVFEAQYGDFLNNAQLVIDAYLCSAESKWGRQCGLVLLVPHGLEGMGSEHSSARLERYLQLSAEDPNLGFDMNKSDFSFNQLKNTNWIIANCTTPANFFHILRRQIALPFRKPLVIMSPKSLLRHPECKSNFDEMKENTTFQSIIPDMGPASHAPNSVRKHILCSGKVYYDLKERRQKQDLESSISITRIEQLCPFPFDYVSKEIHKYSQSEICWVQEEHKNQGAWNYILERLTGLLTSTKWHSISYAGRAVSPVPAVSTPHKHNQEKEELLEAAMVTEDDAEQRGY